MTLFGLKIEPRAAVPAKEKTARPPDDRRFDAAPKLRHWPLIARVVGLLLLAGSVIAYGHWQRPGDLLEARVLNYSRCQEKVVALTFDDGPHPVTTPLLLDVLRRYHAHATFYVVGTKAEQAPDLLLRMRHEGDEVGNHTYSHDNLDKLSENEIQHEIEFGDRDISVVTGVHPAYVRPPGGEYDMRSITVYNRLHRIFALWSVNPGDWASPPVPAIVDRVLKQVRPGVIVLMHDDSLNTVEALPTILEGLRQRGLRCVTTGQLELLSRGAS